jgi:hypothetical protein
VPEVESAERPQSFWVRWLLMVTVGVMAFGIGMMLIVFVALFAAPLAATFRGFHQFHQRPV